MHTPQKQLDQNNKLHVCMHAHMLSAVVPSRHRRGATSRPSPARLQRPRRDAARHGSSRHKQLRGAPLAVVVVVVVFVVVTWSVVSASAAARAGRSRRLAVFPFLALAAAAIVHAKVAVQVVLVNVVYDIVRYPAALVRKRRAERTGATGRGCGRGRGQEETHR